MTHPHNWELHRDNTTTGIDWPMNVNSHNTKYGHPLDQNITEYMHNEGGGPDSLTVKRLHTLDYSCKTQNICKQKHALNVSTQWELMLPCMSGYACAMNFQTKKWSPKQLKQLLQTEHFVLSFGFRSDITPCPVKVHMLLSHVIFGLWKLTRTKMALSGPVLPIVQQIGN